MAYTLSLVLLNCVLATRQRAAQTRTAIVYVCIAREGATPRAFSHLSHLQATVVDERECTNEHPISRTCIEKVFITPRRNKYRPVLLEQCVR